MPTRTLKLNIDARQAKQGADQFATGIRGITRAVKDMEKATASSFTKLSAASKQGLDSFGSKLSALNKVSVSGNLTKGITKLGMAMKEFKAPSKTQINNLAAFAAILPKIKLPRSDFTKLGRMSAAMKDFKAPSKAQVNNFIEFTQALRQVKLPPNMNHITEQLERIARASMRASAGLRGVQRRLGGAGVAATRAGARFTRATGHMRGMENAFDGTYQAATLLRRFLGVFTFARFTQSVFEATTAYERFLNLNKAIAQSINEPFRGAAQYDELRKVTNKLGGDLGVALEEFGKFSAAARTSGLSAEKTMDTYRALTGAATVLGLSQERTKLSFLAVTQILSKGRVSTEELRRQLGEQIPGLFEDFSKEIKALALDAGVQIDSLDDALRRGLVSGRGGILVLEKILREKYGKGVEDALKRADIQLKLLRNTFFDLRVQIGKAGFMTTLAEAFERVNIQLQREEFTSLANKIGQTLANAALKASDAFAWMLDNMDKVTMAAKVFVSVITVGALQRFALGIASMGAPMANLLVFFGTATRQMLGMKVAADAAATSVTRLGFAIRTAMIGTGIGAVVVGLGALTASIISGAKRTEELKNNFADLNKEPVTAGQKLHFIFSSVMDVFSKMGKWIKTSSMEMEGFMGILKKVFDIMVSIRNIVLTIPLGIIGKIEAQSIRNNSGALTESRDNLKAAIRQRAKEVTSPSSEGGRRVSAAEKSSLKALGNELKRVEEMIEERVDQGLTTGFRNFNIVEGGTQLGEKLSRTLEEAVREDIFQGRVEAAAIKPGDMQNPEFWSKLSNSIGKTTEEAEKFRKSQDIAMKGRDKIDPFEVFGVSLKSVQALNKEYAGMLRSLLPVESATSNYLVKVKDLNELEASSQNLLKNKEMALANYTKAVHKTTENEEQREAEIAKMNEEVVLAKANTDLYASALKMLNRQYAATAVQGGAFLASVAEGLERIDRMAGSLDEATTLNPNALEALTQLKDELGGVADELFRISNLKEAASALNNIMPGLGEGASAASQLGQFEMMGRLLSNPDSKEFEKIMSRIPDDQRGKALEGVAKSYGEMADTISKTTFTGAESFIDKLTDVRKLALTDARLQQTKDRITELQELQQQGPLTGEQFTEMDTLSRLQPALEMGARDQRLDLGIGTATDGFSAALDEMLLSAQSWQQQVGDILAQPLNQLADGIGNAASQILVMGADAGEVFKQLGQTILSQLVSSLAKLGVQMLMNALLGKTMAAATTAASVAQAAAISAAWATPAALVNAASFGAGAAAGTAAITGSIATVNALSQVGGVGLYAKGGVVDSPTMFSHTGGLGLMGEAGPEAIMPLQRGKDGKLGVAASGGAGGGTTNQYSISIDARGAEQGVEEKVQEALVASLPMIVNLTTQASKNQMADSMTRRRL